LLHKQKLVNEFNARSALGADSLWVHKVRSNKGQLCDAKGWSIGYELDEVKQLAKTLTRLLSTEKSGVTTIGESFLWYDHERPKNADGSLSLSHPLHMDALSSLWKEAFGVTVRLI
jgi:hypothetical protein